MVHHLKAPEEAVVDVELEAELHRPYLARADRLEVRDGARAARQVVDRDAKRPRFAKSNPEARRGREAARDEEERGDLPALHLARDFRFDELREKRQRFLPAEIARLGR